MIQTIVEPTLKCRGKLCYMKKEAQRIKNQLYKYKSRVLRVYQCKECNYWHLTHKPFQK